MSSEDDQEQILYFDKEACTCKHEPEQHGQDWEGCEVKACECEAGWTAVFVILERKG